MRAINEIYVWGMPQEGLHALGIRSVILSEAGRSAEADRPTESKDPYF